MTIDEVIQKAYEGGLNKSEYTNTHALLLKPVFWKALGKSMGWEYVCRNCGTDNLKEHEFGFAECCHRWMEGRTDKWLWKWHRFIDHLAEGNSIESYFESL